MKLKHLLLAAFAVLGMGSAKAQIAEGEYFIQNVETGAFLGGGNDWGTHATLLGRPQRFNLSVSGDGYTIDSYQFNKATDHFLATNLYVDGAATSWNISVNSDGTCTIENGGNYVAGNGKNQSVKTVTDAAAASAQWKLITLADVVKMQESASAENPVDVTYFIQNPEFKRNANTDFHTTWTVTGADLSGKPSNFAQGSNDKVANCAESYHSTNGFHLAQSISNLKPGVYKLDAQAFYSPGNGAEPLPYVFVNENKSTFCPIAYGETSMASAYQSFLQNKYPIKSIVFAVSEGEEINLGVHGDTNTGLWNIWGEFALTYFGDTSIAAVELAEYVAAYNAALENANSYLEANMSDEAKVALQNAISENTLDLNNITEDDINAAISNLNAAVVDAKQAIEEKKVADLVAQGPGTDLTSLIVNPSFEDSFTGWVNKGSMAIQGNTSIAKDGNSYAEFWQPNGTKGVEQTIKNLPAGVYTLTVHARTRGTSSASIYINDIKTNLVIDDSEKDYVVLAVLPETSDVKIGLTADGTGAGGSWIACDNFRLTYVGSSLPDLPALAEGAMNKDVEAAQTAAVDAYNAEKTPENYDAAVNAIEEAKASVEQYKNNAVALAAQKALVDGTNIYGEGYEAYAAAYAEKQAAYDNRTLNEVVVNPNAATGWRASTDYNFLLTPWTIGDKACNNFENVLYINTWSVEGDTDGSNFTVPFFEYWTEDAKNLANNTIATSLDVENGLYEATVLVRVRATNGVAATDAAGITLSVNGGEAVDVTDGEQVGESQFTISEVKAEGLVKDGKLNIAFQVTDANLSWLSFKNVKYTKVRDLTPEEEMVVATEEEIAALNAAIEAAEENVIGFKEGNYSPYTNAEAIKALADAKAIDTAEPVPADIVNNAKEALESATWIVNTEEVNAIFNGDFEASYSEKEGTGVTSDRAIYTPEGWTVDYKGDKNDMTILSAGDKADNNFNNITALENGGNHTYLYRGKWGSTTNIDVYQNITLPAGQYYIECDAWKSGLGGDGVVFVDDKKASLDGNDTSWRNLSITFTLEEEKTVKVGFTITHTSDASEKFIGFDNFVLKSMPAIDAAKAELEKAINGVNVPTANVGEGAFQYPAAAIAEINNKIETAKSVLENATSAEEIEAQVEIVNAIEIPALKAPAAGQKFNLILTYSGWAYDNKAITYLANARKDQGNYNIQYLAEANANYAQAFTLTNVEGNKYTMSQLDNDGKERYISTGVPYGGNTGQIRTTTNAEDALVVEVIPTATEGVYNIKNTDANNFIGSQDAGVFTVNSHIDFKIAEAKKATATLKVSDSKYATFVAPFAVAIPTGVKAYTTSSLEDNSELVLDEITGTIPANTPVILSAENTPVNETVSGWGLATTDEYTSGLLTGVYSEVTAPNGSYVLQNQTGRVAFFVVDTEKASPKVTANHAYLTAPTPAAAKILKFPSDKATSIAEVANPMSNVKAIYSVSGSKVNTLHKGLNIVKYNNGQIKKVYIK